MLAAATRSGRAPHGRPLPPLQPEHRYAAADRGRGVARRSIREVRGAIGGPYEGTARRTDFRRQRRLSGGGVLLDLGIHLIDLAVWIVGEAPRAAWATTARRRSAGRSSTTPTSWSAFPGGGARRRSRRASRISSATRSPCAAPAAGRRRRSTRRRSLTRVQRAGSRLPAGGRPAARASRRVDVRRAAPRTSAPPRRSQAPFLVRADEVRADHRDRRELLPDGGMSGGKCARPGDRRRRLHRLAPGRASSLREGASVRALVRERARQRCPARAARVDPRCAATSPTRPRSRRAVEGGGRRLPLRLGRRDAGRGAADQRRGHAARARERGPGAASGASCT